MFTLDSIEQLIKPMVILNSLTKWLKLNSLESDTSIQEKCSSIWVKINSTHHLMESSRISRSISSVVHLELQVMMQVRVKNLFFFSLRLLPITNQE